jgi:hypothetical protein
MQCAFGEQSQIKSDQIPRTELQQFFARKSTCRRRRCHPPSCHLRSRHPPSRRRGNLCVQIYTILKFGNEKLLYMNMSSQNLRFEKLECLWHNAFNENLQIKRNLLLLCVITTVFILVGLLSKTQIRMNLIFTYALFTLFVAGYFRYIQHSVYRHTHKHTLIYVNGMYTDNCTN